MFPMGSNPVVVCSKSGDCRKVATHVLIYLNKTTFKEITDKPKPYCYYHACYMQLATKQQHDILTRIYTVGEWMERVRKYEKDRFRSDKITPRY